MVQGRSGLSFTAKPFQRLVVVGYFFGEEFESDKTVQPSVLRLIDDTHATAAKLFNDAVVRESLANQGLGISHQALILGCGHIEVNGGPIWASDNRCRGCGR